MNLAYVDGEFLIARPRIADVLGDVAVFPEDFRAAWEDFRAAWEDMLHVWCGMPL